MIVRFQTILLLGVIGFSFSICALEGPDLPANGWRTLSTPFRPVNVAAADGTLWVCGADEMILSSKDGGTTWQTKHRNPDGEVLLNVSFVDNNTGHAAGTGGLILSTIDGGQTWTSHHLPETVRSFSFADAKNGIVVASEHEPKTDFPKGTTIMEGLVKITHDGGEHWDDVTLDSDELRSYTGILSVAALDSSHYLMLRRQPNVEDAFVITVDGGKSWKLVHMQNDASNRVLARTVFVHQGEYWGFGHELVHREKGGGYGVPLTIHSKDGEVWTHGISGPNEFEECNSQGCHLWDGVVETLYGEHEQFWSMPQDHSLSDKWAIVGNTACTVNGGLKCSPATLTEKPQPRPEGGGLIYISLSSGHFADGCLECNVEPIKSDKPGARSMGKVEALLKVRRDGSVSDVSVDFPNKGVAKIIANQLSAWLFEPAHNGGSTVEAKRKISMVLMYAGFPGRPETDRCSLHSLDEFSRQVR